MRRYKISEELINAVINSPDNRESTIKGRTNAAKFIGDRIIRLTYVRESDQTVVTTVSPDESYESERPMRIEYDNDVDALYIHLRDVDPVDTADVEESVTVDLHEDGHIVGLEVLDAAERLGLESLLNVSIENMPLERIAAE